MNHIRMTELDNGLRVITDQVRDISSVAMGIWVGVGSRHQEYAHSGAAHMIEHMMFKGTDNRSAQQIAQEVEDLGAHINAYTSREVTSYQIHGLTEHLERGIDILGDMFQNYTLPDDEIERERKVILQEISMVHDTPDDLVHDNYYEIAYPKQPLGAPILGTPETVNEMDRATLLDYIVRLYTPSRTVISAAGNVDHDALVDLVEQKFTRLPSDVHQGKVGANYHGGDLRIVKDLEQAHFIIGFQGLSRLDDDYYKAQALSVLLGGGMSSRLFQEVREKRGLAYEIYSFHLGHWEDGQFGIYAGTGPGQLDEILPLICDEVGDVMANVTQEELDRAIAQLRASTLMSRESMMRRADQQAKHLLYREQVLDLDKMIEKISHISREDIKRVGQKIFASKPTISALGAVETMEEYGKVSERLAA